jgi:rhodanese-related sulfurtransferase
MMDSQGVKCISPPEAWELLKSNPRAVLIDIRSSMEYLFVGHPTGSVHVPWIDAPNWTVNPDFVTEVRKVMLGGFSTDQSQSGAPIVLICRSGKRSLEAGRLLKKHGFSDVLNVSEGFEGELDNDHHRSTVGGWRFNGLPWEQC